MPYQLTSLRLSDPYQVMFYWIQVQKVVHETKFKLRFPIQHVYLAQFDRYETSKPLKVSVVSSISTGSNFIFAETF